MLANLKIICQFHAHPLHQNSVDIFWAEIYRGRLFLGPNLVYEYQITAHPYGVDVISPPPYCTRVSKDTESSSCERKILGHQYIVFLDISNISASFAGILMSTYFKQILVSELLLFNRLYVNLSLTSLPPVVCRMAHVLFTLFEYVCT
jgi:hypothetical protein